MAFPAALLALAPKAFDLIDNLVPDKKASEKLKQELSVELDRSKTAMEERAQSLIMAEAKGESWMQRNARPAAMFVFLFMIFNNYVILPYASVFGLEVSPQMFPDELWTLYTSMALGYVGLRSFEKYKGIR